MHGLFPEYASYPLHPSIYQLRYDDVFFFGQAVVWFVRPLGSSPGRPGSVRQEGGCERRRGATLLVRGNQEAGGTAIWGNAATAGTNEEVGILEGCLVSNTFV